MLVLSDVNVKNKKYKQMKKINIKYILVAFCALFFVFSESLAQVNTIYYMESMPTRHKLNPAFQPLAGGYFDGPILPSLYISAGNNSLSFGDVVFPQKIDGKMQTITFLHPQANKDNFYNTLKAKTRLHTEFELNLLAIGFRIKKGYVTFGISQKFDQSAFVPKDLMKFAIYGTPDTTNVNTFNFKSLAVSASSYTELALGYSHKINEKLSVGGKFKYLLGQGNVSLKTNGFALNTSREKWDANIRAEINAAIPFSEYERNNEGKLENITFQNNIKIQDLFFKPQGQGVALDLGATYGILDNKLRFSLSALDIGFIRWGKHTINASANGDFVFEGINFNDKSEDYLNSLLDSFEYNTSNSKYSHWLSAKVLAGVEYSILNNKITFGLLSKSTIVNKGIFEELTTSVNFMPINWFNTTFSYSFIHGKWSNIGFGIGGRLGPFNMFLAADYVPTYYTPEGIPYKTKTINVQTGFILTFNNPKKVKDSDGDGVKNKLDLCPNTPLEVVVDSVGCPVDTDKDGVPDYLDLCQLTPDSVAVDSVGCPIDTDKDGVADYLDECPDTEEGTSVDRKGCPSDDTDEDGVPDYLDKCPNTPAEAKELVNSDGCPIDTDKDGVADFLDKCPNTPENIQVDSIGCPVDTDEDGVADYLDKCPDTVKGAKGFVDSDGCPLDTDNDVIPDLVDDCPTIPGVIENNGCPEIKQTVKQTFERALQGIQFETGKATIISSSYPLLNQIADIMIENKDYFLTISGHTDNVGNADANMKLSEDRANAVKDYLVKGGVQADRITAKGFGDTKPVASNNTAAGRAKNRRVEFTINFERDVEVEK
jgi:outer membrane protein OmpA-like peptidoglycan-associated protein